MFHQVILMSSFRYVFLWLEGPWSTIPTEIKKGSVKKYIKTQKKSESGKLLTRRLPCQVARHIGVKIMDFLPANRLILDPTNHQAQSIEKRGFSLDVSRFSHTFIVVSSLIVITTEEGYVTKLLSRQIRSKRYSRPSLSVKKAALLHCDEHSPAGFFNDYRMPTLSIRRQVGI